MHSPFNIQAENNTAIFIQWLCNKFKTDKFHHVIRRKGMFQKICKNKMFNLFVSSWWVNGSALFNTDTKLKLSNYIITYKSWRQKTFDHPKYIFKRIWQDILATCSLYWVLVWTCLTIFLQDSLKDVFGDQMIFVPDFRRLGA